MKLYIDGVLTEFDTLLLTSGDPVDPPVEPPIDPPVEPPIDPPTQPPSASDIYMGTIKAGGTEFIRQYQTRFDGRKNLVWGWPVPESDNEMNSRIGVQPGFSGCVLEVENRATGEIVYRNRVLG